MAIHNDLNFAYTVDDYLDVKEKFIRLCNNVGIDNQCIGFFGKVGFPGISDIDALVVSSPEKIGRLDALFKELRNTNVDFGYLFWHPPVYVLETKASSASNLHTLQGLLPVEPGGIISKINTKLKGNDLNIINIIWFISLMQIMLDQKISLKRGNSLSLRLLLLVYSNLMHSAFEFSDGITKLPDGVPSSDELRLSVKAKKTELYGNEVWQYCNVLFDFTKHQFDLFCEKKINLQKEQLQASLVVSKNVVLRAGAQSGIVVNRFLSQLILNPTACQLAQDYYRGFTELIEYQNYLHLTKQCKYEYLLSGISYPFVEPVRYIASPLKRNTLKLLNNKVLAKL